MSLVGTYYDTPVTHAELNKLEQLVYSADREAAYKQLFPHASSQDVLLMNAVFRQLYIEKKFDHNIHQKYKDYVEYIGEYEKYNHAHTSSFNSTSDPFRRTHLQHSLIALQTILINLGATEEEVRQLHLFHDQSVDNIQLLAKTFHDVEAANNTTEYKDTKFIIVPHNNERKDKFFQQVVDMMSFYFTHSPPEPTTSLSSATNTDPNNSNYNTFSHLLNHVVVSNTSTALQIPTNPLQVIKKQYDNTFATTSKKFIDAAKHREVHFVLHSDLTGWYNQFQNIAPFVLTLIENGDINYKQPEFFPTLSNLLKTYHTASVTPTTQLPILLDVMAYFLHTSQIKKNALDEIRDKHSKSSSQERSEALRKSEHFAYEEFCVTELRNFPVVAEAFSLDALLTLQKKLIALDKAIAQGILFSDNQYLTLLVSKIVPANFPALRTNVNVGVAGNPYTTPIPQGAKVTSANDIKNHFYPTRNKFNTPVFVMSAEDLKANGNIIPSFLLTAMNIYQQIFDLLLDAIKLTTTPTSSSLLSAFSNDAFADKLAAKRFQFYNTYYTMLHSFLSYTADYNVWRFDILNDIFLTAPLYNTLSIDYHKNAKDYGVTTHRVNTSVFNTPPLNTIFPISGSYQDLITRYVKMFYSQPQITTHKYKPFTAVLDDKSLQNIFWDVKAAGVLASRPVVDVICDQAEVLKKKDVFLTDAAKAAEELKDVKFNSKIADAATTTTTTAPTSHKITVFDPKALFPNETQNLKAELEDLVKKQGQRDVPYIPAQYRNNSPNSYIDFAETKSMKNKYCIDANGNINTALTVTNVSSFVVNVYYVDIMNYYKSQYAKKLLSNSSQFEIDANIDLEGLIPHYTNTVDLSSICTQHKIEKWQPFDMNLCIDNLPKYGVFIIEILNGQDALRCCVRKGLVNCLQKQINKGTLLLLLNEEGEVIKHPRAYIGNDVFKPLNADKLLTEDPEAAQAINECLQSITKTTKMTDDDVMKYFIHIPSYPAEKTVLLTDHTSLFGSCAIVQAHNTTFSLDCNWYASVEALATNTVNPALQAAAASGTTTTTTSKKDASLLGNNATINGEQTVSLLTGPAATIGGGIIGAEVLLKPCLYRNGQLIDLSTITIVKASLTISASLQNDVTISDTVDNVDFTKKPVDANGVVKSATAAVCEYLHAFNVPTNLASLQFQLNLVIDFEGKEENLSSSYSRTVNEIYKTSLASGMIFLRRQNNNYFAYVVDKTGRNVPYCQLRVDVQSTMFNSSLISELQGYSPLYTDINGCLELGPLFGVTSVSLSVVNTNYNFTRASLTFFPTTNINQQYLTQWPEQCDVLVDDNAERVPTTKDVLFRYDATTPQDAPLPQITLPLPTPVLFNAMFYMMFKSYNATAPQKSVDTTMSLTSATLTANAHGEQDLLKKQVTQTIPNAQVNNMLTWLVNYGFINLSEVSYNKIRKECNHLLRCTETAIYVYGLQASRSYVLTYNFPALEQSYTTTITTYHNPKQRNDVQHQKDLAQLQYGAILPQQYYYNITLSQFYDYLICKNKILQLKKSLVQQLTVDRIQYDQEAKKLTLQLGRFNTDTTRVALLATNFITSGNPLKQLFFSTHQHQINVLQQNMEKNSKMHNQTAAGVTKVDFVKGLAISGEREYIINRRNLIQQVDQIGCMLPQPTLLLNKRLVRHTDPIQDEEKEKAKKGSVMAKEKEESYAESNHRLARSSAAPRGGFGAASAKSYYSSSYSSNSQHFPSYVSEDSFNSFDVLKYKSSLLCNLSPDENGVLTVEHPHWDKYPTLSVVVYETKQLTTNNFGMSIFTLDLPTAVHNNKDVAQNTITQTVPQQHHQQQSFITDNSFKLAFNTKYQYVEDHVTGLIPAPKAAANTVNEQTGITTIIGPTSTVELEVISSRSDLYALLQSLLSTSTSTLLPSRNGSRDRMETQNMLNKFKFFHTEWTQDFPDQQKLTLLDRHACHEFNLFIFFNDRPFFEKYLRLHLSNKLQKDIVDLWLLSQAIVAHDKVESDVVELLDNIKAESRQVLKTYTSRLMSLNILEQILLLSVVDPAALRTMALQIQQDASKNCSINRDNLAWVTILESCIRRGMLSLSAAVEESQKEDEEVANGDSSDDDSDADDMHEEEAEPEVTPPPRAKMMRREQAPSNQPCPPPPAAPMPIQMQQRAAPVATLCAAPMSMSMARGPAPGAIMERSRAAAPMKKMAMRSMAADMDMMACNSIAMDAEECFGGSLDALGDAFEATANLNSAPAYKPLDKTGEYEERTWYIDARHDGEKYYRFNAKDLVKHWSNFWVDFALYLTTPTMFSIDNNGTEGKTNKPFASSNVIDLIDGTLTEYLLCLALTVLSPQPQSKQALQQTATGAILTQSGNMDNFYIFNANIKPGRVSPQIVPIANNAAFTLQNSVNYRCIKQVTPYPLIVLYKQTRKLDSPKKQQQQQQQDNTITSAASTTTSTTTNDTVSRSLSASQYYIDIFESIQKSHHVYVEKDQMYKNRAYLCKTVISNTSSDDYDVKVLVTLPDNTCSLKYQDTITRTNDTTTIINHNFTTKTIYTKVRGYSSSIIQYSFLLGDAEQYTHYGAVISSPSSKGKTAAGGNELYCFVPSAVLKTREYKLSTSKYDIITLIRNGSNAEILQFLREYYCSLADGELTEELSAEEVTARAAFQLEYLFFKFNHHYNGKDTVQQRFDFYQDVYSVVRGHLTANTTSLHGQEGRFISYSIHFLQQYFANPAQFVINAKPEHVSNLSHAVSTLYYLYSQRFYSAKHHQHLEYLPLVAARIHNSSLGASQGADNSENNPFAISKNKNMFIPDQQLKDQYIRTMNYVLVHSHSVETIPYPELLSLLYYAIVLNQSVRIIALLHTLLKSLRRDMDQQDARRTAQKSGAKTTIKVDISSTIRIQLAYMLIYIDISNYGKLQTLLSQDELNLLAKIFSTSKKQSALSTINTTPQTTYGVALVLSQQYLDYPIKQWKLLFVQAYQYLVEGCVIVEAEGAAATKAPVLTQEDFDKNVAGQSVHQQAFRQDSGSALTPSLSCTVQHSLTATDVTVYYANLSPAEHELVFNIYYIDSELLLSHQPFMHDSSNKNAANGENSHLASKSNNSTSNTNSNDQLTKAHLSLHIPLPKAATGADAPRIGQIQVPLPANIAKEAGLIITAPKTHISANTPLMHSGMLVQTLTKQGIVAVLDSKTHRPLPGVYVKCYQEGSGNSPATFLRDGYTDIRGKVDYCSASNNKKSTATGNAAQRVALIISSPQYGVQVVYSEKPQA